MTDDLWLYDELLRLSDLSPRFRGKAEKIMLRLLTDAHFSNMLTNALEDNWILWMLLVKKLSVEDLAEALESH